MVQTGAITADQRDEACRPAGARLAPAGHPARPVFHRLARRRRSAPWWASPPRTWWWRPPSTCRSRPRAEHAVPNWSTRDKARGVQQAALVALDGDGRVRALVGGVRLRRQPVRPRRRGPAPGRLVVEAVRLSDRHGERATRPTTPVVDEPVTIGGWSPHNFTGAISARSRWRRRWRSRSTRSPRGWPTRSARQRRRHRASARHHLADPDRPVHGAGRRGGEPAGDGPGLCRASPTAAIASSAYGIERIRTRDGQGALRAPDRDRAAASR